MIHKGIEAVGILRAYVMAQKQPLGSPMTRLNISSFDVIISVRQASMEQILVILLPRSCLVWLGRMALFAKAFAVCSKRCFNYIPKLLIIGGACSY